MMNATDRPSKAKPTYRRIDEYANTMFRFEYLHDKWIDRCAAYLVEVFGSRIRGATVVDYAFGRGNWSVAFSRAGASVVYAIDASKSNVGRFRNYCAAHGVRNVRVIHGNILKSDLDIKADIVWIYGILPMIEESDDFVSRIARMARNDKSLFLFYTYDAGSLREFIVEIARGVLFCKTEAAFRGLSPYFSPPARLRARDDLTSPHIHWHSMTGLSALLQRHGINPVREVRGFDGLWRFSKPRPEFAPLHLICQRAKTKFRPPGPTTPQPDLDVLGGMIDALLTHRSVTASEKKKFMIGLLNTHFSTLYYARNPDEVIIQDFLFVLYMLLVKNVSIEQLPRPATDACKAALAKLNSTKPPSRVHAKRSSVIQAFLTRENFRL